MKIILYVLKSHSYKLKLCNLVYVTVPSTSTVTIIYNMLLHCLCCPGCHCFQCNNCYNHVITIYAALFMSLFPVLQVLQSYYIYVIRLSIYHCFQHNNSYNRVIILFMKSSVCHYF